MVDKCGITGKIVLFVFGLIAIVCSGKAARTCEFISFENTSGKPWLNNNLQPPLDTAIAANMGIFRYEILESITGTETNGCVNYEDRFIGMKDTYEALASAQFCALVAPIFGGLGVFLNVVWDVSIVAGMLCLAAAGVQAGTFSMVADPSICFEDDTTECTTKRGTYLSATAFVFFFLCGCMLCCMPIAVEKTRYKKSERGSPPQSKQENPPPATAPSVLQPARVHQTVIIPVVANSNDSSGNKSRNASGKRTKSVKLPKETPGKKLPSSSGTSPSTSSSGKSPSSSPPKSPRTSGENPSGEDSLDKKKKNRSPSEKEPNGKKSRPPPTEP